MAFERYFTGDGGFIQGFQLRRKKGPNRRRLDVYSVFPSFNKDGYLVLRVVGDSNGVSGRPEYETGKGSAYHAARSN